MNDGKHEFHEDNLKPRIANYMVEHEGFDSNPIITYGRKQGPDILATKGEIKRRIEVKGWPLETYADEKKKGQIKKTTPSTQARHWFGEALLGIILAKCEDEKLEIALGFPMMGTYVKLLNKIEWVRRKLGIYCYLVDEGGQVLLFPPEKPISK